MTKINAEQRKHRKEFIAALRSGEYPQGKMALRTNEGYCCMGVAEDVRGAQWVSTGNSAWGIPIGNDQSQSGVLTDESLEYYGFTHLNPFVSINGERWPLALSVLNDSRNMSFEQIADVLEAQPWWNDEYDPEDS